MIKREKITEQESQKLVKINLEDIDIADHVLSFAVLAVTITRDENNNFVYGLDLTSPDLDETQEMDEQDKKIFKGAEVFLQRALKLVTDEMEKNHEREKEAQENPN